MFLLIKFDVLILFQQIVIRKCFNLILFLLHVVLSFFYSRIRRQLSLQSTTTLRIEIRNDPPANLTVDNTASSEEISNINSAIINQFQTGELQAKWANHSATNGSSPTNLDVQEPGNQTSVSLSIISRLELVTPPSSCRLQSACDIQPVLVAYDNNNNIIDKLGSNDQPWQVVASVVGQPSVNVIGAIANYSNGQSQYSTFGVTATGSYKIQFTFITPYNVSR